MIGLFLLAASWSLNVWVPVPPRPDRIRPADADEVVVNGQRIRRVQIAVRTDRRSKTPRCVMRRESGDPELDAAICAQALACNPVADKRKTLAECIMPRIATALEAHYPGRGIGQPVLHDRIP